jgi:hypothetical protein
MCRKSPCRVDGGLNKSETATIVSVGTRFAGKFWVDGRSPLSERQIKAHIRPVGEFTTVTRTIRFTLWLPINLETWATVFPQGRPQGPAL